MCHTLSACYNRWCSIAGFSTVLLNVSPAVTMLLWTPHMHSSTCFHLHSALQVTAATYLDVSRVHSVYDHPLASRVVPIQSATSPFFKSDGECAVLTEVSVSGTAFVLSELPRYILRALICSLCLCSQYAR